MLQPCWLAVASVVLASLVQIADGSSFKVSQCTGNTYFDATALNCLTCGTALTSRVAANTSLDVYGNPTGCTCAAGYAAQPAVCDYSQAAGCGADVCSSCGALGLASSRNASSCAPCGASTTGLDAATGDCGCAGSADGSEALVETSATGLFLGAKECSPCPPRARSFWRDTAGRRADPYTCAQCRDPHASMTAAGECVCDAGYRPAGFAALVGATGITCVPDAQAAPVLSRFPESAAAIADFYSVQMTADAAATSAIRGLTSRYAQHLYLSAAIACRGYKPGGDTAGCSALANLCVLQMHYANAPACALVRDMAAARAGAVNGFSGWPVGMPQLLWGTDFAAVMSDTSLARRMAFKAGATGSSTGDASLALEFYLAKTALNGSFLGIERLTNQLSYCGAGAGAGGIADEPLWLRYGGSFKASYSCDIRALARAGEPLFYDLYVRDLESDASLIAAAAGAATSTRATTTGSSGSSGSGSVRLASLPFSLFPVPVRVVNYRTPAGGKPNANSAWADEADDVLSSRFMLFDPVSAVTSLGQLPEVIRYASSVTLSIRAQGLSAPDKIAPPLLTIEYRERPTAAVLSSAAMATDAVTFRVEYSAALGSYSSTIASLASVAGLAVVLWASVRITAWVRMNARNPLEATMGLPHAGRWLLYAATTAAVAYFWLLIAATGYWLVYFKLQDSVYGVVPPHHPEYRDDVYHLFTSVLWAVFIAYCVRLAYLLYKQVTVDLFFIDWEKPRGALFKMGQDFEPGQAAPPSAAGPGVAGGSVVASVASAVDHKFTPISVWRTVFAANEWSELSVLRRTSLPLTLVLLLLLLEGAQLKYIATPQPDPYNLQPGEINPLLQFSNTCFWYFIIVVCQVVWQWAVGERYLTENPVTHYVDLCTVMKISVLLLDERYRGFYIHGNAPHEHADGDMQELATHLFEEAAAMRVGRGLPGCPDSQCQTFEIHVPALWRAHYERVFRRILDAESASVDAMYGGAQPGVVGALQSAAGLRGGAGVGVGGGGGGGWGQPGAGGAGMAGGAGAGANPAAAAAAAAAAAGLPPSAANNSSVTAILRLRERTRRLAAAYTHLSGFMKGFVEETDPDYKRVWRQRTLLQSAFDFPPDMITEGLLAGSSAGAAMGLGGGPPQPGQAVTTAGAGGLTYIYTDRAYRFERLFFRGIEFDLCAFELLLFCLVDYLQSSPTLAAFITWLVAQAIVYCRQVAGQRNVAYKTLVDDRFLV